MTDQEKLASIRTILYYLTISVMDVRGMALALTQENNEETYKHFNDSVENMKEVLAELTKLYQADT